MTERSPASGVRSQKAEEPLLPPGELPIKWIDAATRTPIARKSLVKALQTTPAFRTMADCRRFAFNAESTGLCIGRAGIGITNRTERRDESSSMIRSCDPPDVDAIFEIINDGARAYRGVIPADCLKEPYMPMEELEHEIAAGISFWGYEHAGRLAGVMGIQHVQDVTLIRHAYVRSANQKQGIGSRLLSHLRVLTDRPLLIGTWADAVWAIRFYEQHGFKLVDRDEKDRLLQKYWTISPRQRETSVVLADRKWQGPIS